MRIYGVELEICETLNNKGMFKNRDSGKDAKPLEHGKMENGSGQFQPDCKLS